MLFLFMVVLFTAGNSHAQPQMGNIPQFLPTSGWQVQQTFLSQVRGLDGVELPCMMSTSYDNGYALRFSGLNQKILAMAVDFRQDVFVQGRKYSAQVRVDDQYSRPIKGTAFSESILIFNMRETDGFFHAIFDAVKMTLDVEDNPMTFALGGVNNALEKLKSCSAGDEFTSNVQQASLPPSAASDSAEPMGWDQEVTPIPAQISKNIKKSQQAKAPLWEAKAGDDMKTTLEGWANRAGVRLDWQATGSNSKVADDVRVQGSFEDAVQTLMARNAAALGLDANMQGTAKTRAKISSRIAMPAGQPPQQLMPSTRMGVTNSTTTSGRWSAPMGVSLQHVLQTWSNQAGVELIWQSNQGFAVKRGVTLGGSYEEALQSLLNQYTDEKIRPAAQLNNDPVTGRRTLFVESSRVL